MDHTLASAIAIGVLLVLMVLGIPVAFSLGISGLLGLALAGGVTLAFSALTNQIVSAPYNFVLTAIPLFVLTAQIVLHTGLGSYLFRASEAVLGRFPGRLALATLGTCTAFAAVTGSSVASVATVGPVALKEMYDRNYSRRLATGIIAGAGGLAIIIPPSIAFILYGYIAEVSVAKMFLAGVFPGLLMATGYAIVILIWCRRKPMAAPPGPVMKPKEAVTSAFLGLPVLVIGLFILGSIYFGIATVTESAAIGVVVALLLAIVYRKFNRRVAKQSLLETARTTGFYFILLVASLTFGYMLTYLGLPNAFTEFILGLGLSKWAVLAFIYVLLLVMGTLMDGTSILLIVVPIVLGPLRHYGFDPIWLGVLLCEIIEIGLATPPYGINIFVLQGAMKRGEVRYSDVVMGSLPFMLSDMVVVALVTIFPMIALWLPSTMG